MNKLKSSLVISGLILQAQLSFAQTAGYETSLSIDIRNKELIGGKTYSYSIHQESGGVLKGGAKIDMSIKNTTTAEKTVILYQTASCRDMYTSEELSFWCMSAFMNASPGQTVTGSYEMEDNGLSQFLGQVNKLESRLAYDCTVKAEFYESVGQERILIKAGVPMNISVRAKVNRCNQQIIAPELLANQANSHFNGVLSKPDDGKIDIYDLYPLDLDCAQPLLPFGEALAAFSSSPQAPAPAPVPAPEPAPAPIEVIVPVDESEPVILVPKVKGKSGAKGKRQR